MAISKLRSPDLRQQQPQQQQSIASLLNLCSDLRHGRILHALLLELCAGPLQLRFLHNSVVRMYGRLRAPRDALRTFSSIARPNAFSWNLAMKALADNRHSREALALFERMRSGEDADVLPDRVSFLACLSACADLGDVCEARKMEACLSESRLRLDPVLCSALVNMYHKCRSLEDALRIFRMADEVDAVCWNTIISAYCQHGYGNEALSCFDRMMEEEVNPTPVTYTTLFNLCANEKWLEKGRQLHACLKKKEKEKKRKAEMESSLDLDVVLANALISMYGKCSSLVEAREVFEEMTDRNCVTWGTMITECTNQMHGDMAIRLFFQMHMEGAMPDIVVRTNALSACASLPNPGLGKHIHATLGQCQLFSDVVVGTALVHMYGKCKLLEQASTAFDHMCERDVISYNVMLASFIHCEEETLAVQHFKQMLQEAIEPVETTFTILLDACKEGKLEEGKFAHACIVGSVTLDSTNADMNTALVTFYGKQDRLDYAGSVFDESPEKDVISWNAMIAAFARQRHYLQAFHCFHQMQMECFIPNYATFSSCLSACVTEASLADGRRMHASIMGASIESDTVVGTSLIHMYARCGSLDHAKLVFEALPHRTVVTWNALISGYAQHGHGEMALELFHGMKSEGVSPDEATFSSVLSACCNCGNVDEGLRCFLYMVEGRGITPTVQHFNCVVNLLSRAGRLEEGEGLLSLMPPCPVDASWTTLLSACRMHLDVERAHGLADQMKLVGFQSDSTSLLIANIFACAEKAMSG